MSSGSSSLQRPVLPMFSLLNKHVLRQIHVHQYEPTNIPSDQMANYRALVRERDQIAIEYGIPVVDDTAWHHVQWANYKSGDSVHYGAIIRIGQPRIGYASS